MRCPIAKIALAGYLGCGNLGDDAVMLGVMDALGTGHEYLGLVGDPDSCFREFGIHGVDRKNMKAVADVIAKSDALVFPGGSIFQDVTSSRSTIYYAGLVAMAKKQNKRVLLLNQGVGPVTSMIGKMQTRKAFAAADLLVVRDPGSAQTARDLGVEKKIHIGADSAFLIGAPKGNDGEGSFNVGSMKSVAIAPRPLHRKDVDVAKLFGETCRLLFQAGYAPTLIEMDANEDGPILEAISKQQNGRIPTLRRLGSPRKVQELLSRMESVIAMRLHAGILASTVGVPCLMLNYDPKVAAFARQLDIGNALPLEGLTAQRIFETFVAGQKSSERNREVVAKKRLELSQEAMRAIDLARDFLK